MSPIFTEFCSPDANFHRESRVFSAPFFAEKTCFLGHLQRFVRRTSRNRNVVVCTMAMSSCRRSARAFGHHGTVLDKSLPCQLPQLRQQVMPGVLMPLKSLHGSTNQETSPGDAICVAQVGTAADFFFVLLPPPSFPAMTKSGRGSESLRAPSQSSRVWRIPSWSVGQS